MTIMMMMMMMIYIIGIKESLFYTNSKYIPFSFCLKDSCTVNQLSQELKVFEQKIKGIK